MRSVTDFSEITQNNELNKTFRSEADIRGEFYQDESKVSSNTSSE